MTRDRTYALRALVIAGTIVAGQGRAAAQQSPPEQPATGVAPPNAVPAPSELAKAEARVHFERGLGLYKEGAFAAALAEFLRSRELFATRSAAQNAALALRRLGRFDESLEMFEQVGRDYPNLPEGDRQALERELSEVRLLVGAITVDATEPDVAIIVDGRERGKTPLGQPIQVAAGSHLVRAYKEGFLSFEARVEVAGRDTLTVTAKLVALTQGGRLRVSEEHDGVLRVVVDGVVVGSTPWEGTLPVGRHTVSLRGADDIGSPPASAVIELNGLTTLSLVAEPLSCGLRVEPVPIGASVALDGVDVGHGAWQGGLRCGEHTVEIAAEGFVTVATKELLAKGRPWVIAVTLERDPTSPMWRAAHPPRITLDVRTALLLGPSLGGDLNDRCTRDCSRSIGTGAWLAFSAGYQFGSGLGVAADGGFLWLGQTVTAHAAEVVPLGLAPQAGTADDVLRVRGPTLGASSTFQRGDRIVWTGRLGVGALFGSWSDTRSGAFSTKPSGGVPYTTPELSERGTVGYLYLNPEARVGARFGDRWSAHVGIETLILIGWSEARWRDATEVAAGVCPNRDVGICAGRGGFGGSQLLGRTMVFVSPSIGLRYEL